MVYIRRLLKYFYPKPRKKSVFILLVLLICFVVFYMQRTSHRKSKHSLLTNNNALFSHYEFNDEVVRVDVVAEGDQIVDSRVEKTQNAYNITITPAKAVLVFTGSDKSVTKDKLKFIFKSMKVNFDFLTWNRFDDYFLSLPRLVDKYQMARYQSFVFTNENIFDSMDSYNWGLVKRHCQQFNVGIIILCHPVQSDTVKSKRLKSLPLSLLYGVKQLEDVEIPKNRILQKVKSPNVLRGRPPGTNHVLFHYKHKTFKRIMLTNIADDGVRARRDTSDALEVRLTEQKGLYTIEKSPMVVYDRGEIDGIRKFVFGVSFWDSWLYQLVFVDALSVLSDNNLGFGTKRYIQIDIDDMFVGMTGRRLVKEDIDALVDIQRLLSTRIDGFKFKLGYSAQRYQLSNLSSEVEGDEYLVSKHISKEFDWFCHTSKHIKPHQYSKVELINDFEINKQFAQKYDLNVDNSYAVAPHHSGVYPVHNPLYRAWKAVYDIKVTSTEGYPHLYPAHGRKGFIHKDIMVLPRQTCGLFTKTFSEANHPKGSTYLYDLTQGGELFWTFVFNPVNIYMTHMNNYGMKERLAIPLFTNVTNFIQKWTNLQLVHVDPITMATKYFEFFHKQMEPIWTDPCTDNRHQKIWNHTERYCKPSKKSTTQRLPDVLILGPQKSGTTALLTFLSLHPDIVRSRRSNSSYEEVQFFNKNNYKDGIEWYLNYFPVSRSNDRVIYVDKSANYFDSLKAPLRAASLLPNVKLVVILIDPRLRAYSWYQHMRSKSSSTTLTHSFYDVITTFDQSGNEKFDMLHAKCLLPGRYAEALERWLQYYDESKLLVLDGNELKENPVETMNKMQTFLALSTFNFQKYLRYSQSKKFFCTYNAKSYNCLGKGKGRHYDKMSDKEWSFLTDYYYLPNLKLYELLKKLKKTVPKWLQAEINRVEKTRRR